MYRLISRSDLDKSRYIIKLSETLTELTNELSKKWAFGET